MTTERIKIKLEQFREYKKNFKAVIYLAEALGNYEDNEVEFDQMVNSLSDEEMKQLFKKIKSEKISQEDWDPNSYIYEVAERYEILEEELFQYDLSEIPYKEWEGIALLSETKPLNISGSNAKIDFDDLDWCNIVQGFIATDCSELKNLDQISGVLFPRDFHPKVVKENTNRFLSAAFSDPLNKKYQEKELELADFIPLTREQLDELFVKNIEQHMTWLVLDDQKKVFQTLGIIKYIEIMKQEPDSLLELGIAINDLYDYYREEEKNEYITKIQKTDDINKIIAVTEDVLLNGIVNYGIFRIDDKKYSKKFKEKHSQYFPNNPSIPKEVLDSFYNKSLKLDDLIRFGSYFANANLDYFINDPRVLHFFNPIGDHSLATILGPGQIQKIIPNHFELFRTIYHEGYDRDAIHSWLKSELTKARKNNQTIDMDRFFEKSMLSQIAFRWSLFQYTEDGETPRLSPEFKNLGYTTEYLKSIIPEYCLDENAPTDLKQAFYRQKLDIKMLELHPEWIPFIQNKELSFAFKGTFVADSYSSTPSSNFVKDYTDRFGNEFLLQLVLPYVSFARDFMLKEYKPSDNKEDMDKQFRRMIYNKILTGIPYGENMPPEFKEEYPDIFLDENTTQELKDKFYQKKIRISDLGKISELNDLMNKINIASCFTPTYNWVMPLFNNSTSLELANYKRLRVISAYSKINDVDLEKQFIEHLQSSSETMDIEKIDYIADILSKLSLSNSIEMYSFKKQIAAQLLKTDHPISSLDKLENIFIKNNIPTVGKIFSCFEIMHPNFSDFNFEHEGISPVLKSISTSSKRIVVFSDLIRASFGSNNRSVNTYLRDIEMGNLLYNQINLGERDYNALPPDERETLITFSRYLSTLYDNTIKGKQEKETFQHTSNVINDINELKKKISPNGTLDYNLGDRIISMFCHFAGIDTLADAKAYVSTTVQSANQRNRQMATHNLELVQGDFVKGIGDIKYLRNILQNGSVSKEYLGADATSDMTPLDTDVAMITTNDGNIGDKISSSASSTYGPIWFVLKNDERFSITRTEYSNSEKPIYEPTKLEVFNTLEKGHYGIRTGFASSHINSIVMEKFDPRVGLEIALNGFYIPIANTEGQILFTPEDYDQLRNKMSGLTYYGENEYNLSNHLITDDTTLIANQIEQSNIETSRKRKIINLIIQEALAECGLGFKDKIDGDLSSGIVEFIDTGSTGRGTNKPGDGDFDFVMRLDRNILRDNRKIETLKQTIAKKLGKENTNETTWTGDFRLKNVVIDESTAVDIDITFSNKTDKVSYSTDMSLKDRLETIYKQNQEQYHYVVANILLAKQVLKEAEVYKPDRGMDPQGGLGGVGIENWILQNGGSFIDAAYDFLAAAKGKNFNEFQKTYSIWDFGENHLAENRDQYAHDNFVSGNMSESGYNKMVIALQNYVMDYEHRESETIERH